MLLRHSYPSRSNPSENEGQSAAAFMDIDEEEVGEKDRGVAQGAAGLMDVA